MRSKSLLAHYIVGFLPPASGDVAVHPAILMPVRRLTGRARFLRPGRSGGTRLGIVIMLFTQAALLGLVREQGIA